MICSRSLLNSLGPSKRPLDRFPNSKVIKKLADSVVIEAETIDQGAMMWLLSQGKRVKVLSPDNFKAKMKQELKRDVTKLYFLTKRAWKPRLFLITEFKIDLRQQFG